MKKISKYILPESKLRLWQQLHGWPGHKEVLSEMSSSEMFHSGYEERVDTVRQWESSEEKIKDW